MAETPMNDILNPPENEEQVQTPDPGARKRFQQREKEAVDQGKLQLQTEKTEEKQDERDEKKEVKEAKSDPKVLDELKEFDRKYKASIAQANAERSKRQDLERQLAEVQRANKEPPKPFWDAPDEALKRLDERIQQSTQSVREELRAELIRNRLNTSESVARGKYKDFDQAIETFSEMATENPALGSAWLQSPDPAEFAYKQGKAKRELQEVGDVDKLRAKIEKEVRLKLEQELKDKEEKLKAERDALPGSLSDARGTTQNKFVWSGPTPMGEILKH